MIITMFYHKHNFNNKSYHYYTLNHIIDELDTATALSGEINSFSHLHTESRHINVEKGNPCI